MESQYKNHKKKKLNVQKLIDSSNMLFEPEDKTNILLLLKSYGINIGQCTCCKKLFIAGYVIDDGEEFYCSDDCFEQNKVNEEEKSVIFKELL